MALRCLILVLKFHMHLRSVISLIFAALISPTIFAQDKTQPTADELVSKNIEAKGGATALHDLQSLRLTGKLLVQQGGQIELAYLQIKKRPDEVLTEASLQGMTQIQAYDGKEGWKVSPFFGRKDPERMSADDVKALVEDTEIDGALVDWKAKGSAVEYLGTEDVEGGREFCLSGSRSFPRDSRSDATHETRRARRGGDRSGGLRKSGRRIRSDVNRLWTQGSAGQTKNYYR